MRRSWIACVALVAASGCPAAAVDDGDTGAGTASDDTAGEATTTTGAGATTGEDPTATGVVDDTTGAEAPGVLARDIRIDLVEANQGVAVDLARGGEWLGPAERQAPILQKRIALVRALWKVPDDFDAREIEGRLVLEHADGTIETKIDSKVVEDDSFIGDLDRAFFWGVEAETMLPGLKFRVELYEVDDALADTPEPERTPTVPQGDDFAVFGVETSYQVMKVVVVPFNYDNGTDCVTEADVTDETMQRFQDWMYMQNPIDRLDYEVHAPLAFNGDASNFGELNQILVNLRFDDNALPETYYYGLIDVCSGGLGGAGGQANGIPDDPVNPDNAFQRVSSGLSVGVDFSSETIVHEVGHCQGRRHIACDGEAGTDPTYPHDGGAVGEWGFGVVDFQLRHPTSFKDYMTYCHPTWVGNWGWNKVYPTIKGLSEWDADFPGNGKVDEDPYSGSILVGTVLPDGRELWSTVPGGIETNRLTDGNAIEMKLADGTVQSLGARLEAIDDAPAGTFQVVAPLPDAAFDLSTVESFTRVTPQRRIAIPRESISVHHGQRVVHRTKR